MENKDKEIPGDASQEESEQSREEILSANEELLAAFLARSEGEAVEVSQDLPEAHRSGFVAVVGKPNVGKSTLMNSLLGEKLAIVSPKPQTTRERQLGILTQPDTQIIFVDTPGLHQARNMLGEYMVEVATDAIIDADVVLWLVDVSEPPSRADKIIAELITRQKDMPVIVALNKCDLLPEDQGEDAGADFRELLPDAEPLLISAATGENLDDLMTLLVRHLPAGPRFYPKDQISDTQLRDTVAEMIREQVLGLYQHEVPHSVAVVVDEFKERSEDLTYVAATIYVERESQKGILIGKQGRALKELGALSRAELESMLDTRVYLELWVKVLKNWRKDDAALRRLGFKLKD